MLVNYTNEVFEEWYDRSGRNYKLEKDELLKAGTEHVFKYWENLKRSNTVD